MKCFFTQNLYSRHLCFCNGYLPRGRPEKKVWNLFRSWEQGLAGLNKISTFAENHVVVLSLFVLLKYMNIPVMVFFLATNWSDQ